MELAWIEDFLALCQTQNFTEAAAQRCTTQPAFSRRMQQLEEWLGAVLFDRATRPIKLTSGGEEFQRRAQRIREDMLDARRIAMSSQSYYQQATRIYATTAVAVGILPKWLKKGGNLNHSILTSSTGGCLEALRQKRADRIFLPWFSDDVKDTQLAYEKVTDDDLVLIESPNTPVPVLLKKTILDGPIMMHGPGTIFGQQIARHLTGQNITCERTIACESSSAETLLALVKQGLGAAWVPKSLIDSTVKRCEVPQKLDVPCEIVSVTRAD